MGVNAALDQVAECRAQQEAIARQIAALCGNVSGDTEDADAATAQALVELLVKSKDAYHEAAVVLKSVPHILTDRRDTRKATLKAALSEFLRKRDQAQVSIAIHDALHKVMQANKQMSEETALGAEPDTFWKRWDLRLEAIPLYMEAVHVLAGLDHESRAHPLQLPYLSNEDGEQLLLHAVDAGIAAVDEHINRGVGVLTALDRGLEAKKNTYFSAVASPGAPVSFDQRQALLSGLLTQSDRIRALTTKSCAAIEDIVSFATTGLGIEPANEYYLSTYHDHERLTFNRFRSIIMNQQELLDAVMPFLQTLQPPAAFANSHAARLADFQQIAGNIAKLAACAIVADNELQEIATGIVEGNADGRQIAANAYHALGGLPEIFEEASAQLRHRALTAKAEADQGAPYSSVAQIFEQAADDFLSGAAWARRAMDSVARLHADLGDPRNDAAIQAIAVSRQGIDWTLSSEFEAERFDDAAKSTTAAQATPSAAATGKGRAQHAAPANPPAPLFDEKIKRAADKSEARGEALQAKCEKARKDANDLLEQMRKLQFDTANTWRNVRASMERAAEYKGEQLEAITKARNAWEKMKKHPDYVAKHKLLDGRVRALEKQKAEFDRTVRRYTVEAIALRPTGQGVAYLQQEGLIKKVTQPTWIELRDPDAEYRAEQDRKPSYFVHEYVFTAKADDQTPNQQFVLHRHFKEANPQAGVAPDAAHWKNYQQRHLGRQSETVLSNREVLDKVYRNADTAGAMNIVHGFLRDERERQAIPRSSAEKTAPRKR